MKQGIIIACVILLAGCATPQQQAARTNAAKAKIVMEDHQRCANDFGLKKGTEAYAKCREGQTALRIQAAAVDGAAGAAQAATSRAMINAGAGMIRQASQPVQPVQPVIVQPAPTMRTTTCTGGGSIVNCTSF